MARKDAGIDGSDPKTALLPAWVRIAAKNWHYPLIRTLSDVEDLRRQWEQTFGARWMPTDDEMEAAVCWLAGPAGRQTDYPTARELEIAVRRARNQNRPMRPTDTGPAARIANAKAAMLAADTWAARWDALCEACQEDSECIEVDQWAEQRWGQAWVDGRDAVRMDMAREWREAANQMDGVRRVA
jgi:hypothetical protein